MHSARASTHSAMPRSERLATWQPRGEVVVLADIDLATVQGAQVDARAPLVFDEDTEIDGAVLWFDAPLGGDVSITTDPFDPGRASHWRNQVVVLGERTVVRAGEPAHLTYRYRVPGHRDGLDLVVGDSDAPVSLAGRRQQGRAARNPDHRAPAEANGTAQHLTMRVSAVCGGALFHVRRRDAQTGEGRAGR
jgi:hypothetical protein